jgi:DNA transformation protein and related proteins
MAKPLSSFAQYVMDDLFSEIEDITIRAMFGGYGLYHRGMIFGIIAEDQLFFKVNETNRKKYQKAGSHQFVYQQGGHPRTTMNYWLVTDEMQSPAELKKLVYESAAITVKEKLG